MTVYAALTTATTQSLNVVTTSVGMIDRTVSIADNYLTYVEAHSLKIKAIAAKSFAIDADEINRIVEQDVKHRVTTRELAHEERMKDENYARIYNRIVITNDKVTLPALEAPKA
jgi:hypothetical protein